MISLIASGLVILPSKSLHLSHCSCANGAPNIITKLIYEYDFYFILYMYIHMLD